MSQKGRRHRTENSATPNQRKITLTNKTYYPIQIKKNPWIKPHTRIQSQQFFSCEISDHKRQLIEKIPKIRHEVIYPQEEIQNNLKQSAKIDKLSSNQENKHRDQNKE